MGVDINTYRCRVGLFVSSRGAGMMMMPFVVDFSHEIKLIGAVSFIRILLIIAGIEQNPGPTDQFIYRYQYLLIEIGTEVLRKVFDNLVNNDFMRHLNANPIQHTRFQYLMLKGIITDAQKTFLPPLDKKPASSNYDITLLVCLFRNVCGLRIYTDTVWKNPSPTDFSLEADIARLRECRNDLAHLGTVYISEADLTTKWNELSTILKRLNPPQGIPNLSSLINDAEHEDVDKELKEKYDAAIKSWVEIDLVFNEGIKKLELELKAGQSQLKVGQSELKAGQSELKAGQSELKAGNSELKAELRAGQSELKAGQSELKAELKAGQSELKAGQSEFRAGQSELNAELKAGQSKLKAGQSELKAELRAGQSELKAELRAAQSELKAELRAGQSELKAGQSELKAELRAGQSELKAGQSELKAGLSELKDGQAETKAGQSDLYDGQQSIVKGIENLEQNLQKCKSSTCLNVEKDFKDHLMRIYRKYCCTLQVSPLCYEDEDKVDLLTVYQPPTMCHVPYHREQSSVENCPISSYEEIFCKEDHSFRNIYITGDAGVGKTSFCQCMALLWCKSQSGEHVSNSIMQKDIDFMAKFELVFYVSLRESDREDILDMIIDQLFYTKSKDNREEMYKSIENVLKERECLIILDGLDEWSPKTSARKVCVLPKKVPSERCIHLTTCRPYIIENNRLSRNDLDHQVQITGIHGISSERYISAIVNHVNGLSKDNKNPADFMEDAKLCGLDELLSIPIITSQLIVVWFDKKLTDMSRASIYSNIVEMLFERAEMRKIQFLSPTDSELQLPDCLSEFIHIKKHISLLKEICMLSFRSLFKQDDCSSILVYTEELLMKEPYSFSAEKIDFLCKIGILSKNKVIGRFGKKEHKLSFLHKSYVEFLAALFVSSFDTSNLFDSVVKEWSTVSSVLQFQNFSLLLAGLSYQKIAFLLNNIYLTVSEDLNSCRKNAIFHHDRYSYRLQIKSLQNIVLKCFREIRKSSGRNLVLKLEDFIFDRDCNMTFLKRLLLLKRACVKSIYVKGCKYLDEFSQVNSLQCLHIGDVLPGDYAKFTECMLQNKSTLQTVCIEGWGKLIPELPVRRLQRLTSLSLSCVKMHHNSLCNLIKFLIDNVRIENIKLDRVSCKHHQNGDSGCSFALNLPNHTKLSSLYLNNVTILCKNVNNFNLKSVTLYPFEYITLFPPLPERTVIGHIDVFLNCIECSQLEHLNIEGSAWYDYGSKFYNNTMKTLTSTVKSLPYIKSLTLVDMYLPDDVLLKLHSDITQVKIKLDRVTMSRQCFHCLIDRIVHNKSVIKVALHWCKISSVGETYRKLSWQESIDYMSEYLTPIPTVNIRTTNRDFMLSFETNCQ